MKLEEVDRAIYEAIRLKVVAGGYLPDIVITGTGDAYNTAKENLKATLPDKELIEIFGVGSMENKGQLRSSRITIDRTKEAEGDLGGFPSTKFESYDDAGTKKFKKLLYPSGNYDLEYDVRVICISTRYERLMSNFVRTALKKRGYLDAIGDNGASIGEQIFIEMIGMSDMSNEDFIEKVYKIRVNGVWLEEFEELSTNIPELKEIVPSFVIANNSANLEELSESENEPVKGQDGVEEIIETGNWFEIEIPML